MASPTINRASFTGSLGHELAARIDLPSGPVRAFALFAHCFTCSKEVLAAKRISKRLAEAGVGVLRFDFTGLGSSKGEFANTDFSSNIEDLVRAADHLRETYAAPTILIGHSLGGAAVLAAASRVPEAKAVVTIGAPADVGHILHMFDGSLEEIRARGEAEVNLAGRAFTIRRSFVEDVQGHRLEESVRKLGKALLVLHAPLDETVGIENAQKIFQAAKHPKSFVSLDGADHLVTGPDAAAYAARVIVAWASRFLPKWEEEAATGDHILVRETLQGTFQTLVKAGPHLLLADEPESAGGLGSGPDPYEFLSIALGSCTAMTLRLHSQQKNLGLGRISVKVRHQEAPGKAGEGVAHFERLIHVEGGVSPEMAVKLREIAENCPVHRTLAGQVTVATAIGD